MVSLRINLLNFYVVFLPRVLFICFIVIDSLNGYLQEFYNLHTPIGVLSRGIMLLLISSCVFVKINLFIYKLFKLLVWVYLFAIPLWYINGSELIFFREVQYLFRFIYFFCILFYFYSYRCCFSIKELLNLIVISAFIISVINIFCFF